MYSELSVDSCFGSRQPALWFSNDTHSHPGFWIDDRPPGNTSVFCIHTSCLQYKQCHPVFRHSPKQDIKHRLSMHIGKKRVTWLKSCCGSQMRKVMDKPWEGLQLFDNHYFDFFFSFGFVLLVLLLYCEDLTLLTHDIKLHIFWISSFVGSSMAPFFQWPNDVHFTFHVHPTFKNIFPSVLNASHSSQWYTAVYLHSSKFSLY